MTGRAAFLVAEAGASGAALDQLLSAAAVPLSSLDILCCQQSSVSISTKYDVAMVSSSIQLSRESLGQAARILAPGAKLYVFQAATQGATALDTLQKDLVLSGFADSKLISDAGNLLVQATMPNFAIGTKSALTLKRPQPASAPAAASTAPAAKKWTLPADDEGEELLDDAELLTAEDTVRPFVPSSDDCEVGQSGRKACKNCSCGRAEAEQAEVVKLSAGMLENPQSACGSCYLGDAFRCGTCPYRGLPAFEAGKKIQLSSDLLAADF